MPYPTPTASKTVKPPSMGQPGSNGSQPPPGGSACTIEGKKIKKTIKKQNGISSFENRFIAGV